MNLVESNEQLTKQWIAAFNVHDVTALLALYHEQAAHFSPRLKLRNPETNGWIKGKEALHHWWADSFQRLPSLRYELVNCIANEQQVFMEYQRTVDAEAATIIAEVLEIKEGKIICSRIVGN
jgi:predicted SnoaL-like aldol condensation-catalyzing enzyme